MDPLGRRAAERAAAAAAVRDGAALPHRARLLEDAARAYRAELESRTRLDALPDEIQQVIFGQLCNALHPRSAVAYSSASKREQGAAGADAAGRLCGVSARAGDPSCLE